MEDSDDGSDGEVVSGTRKGVPLNDSIEIESDDVMPSQDESVDVLENEMDEEEDEVVHDSVQPTSPWEESSPIEEREPKRRRLTISPLRESSPLDEAENHLDTGSSTGSSPPVSIPNGDSLESIEEETAFQDDTKSLQQPTFRAPPRFKPIEADLATEGLPAAFSPQRRGAKYLPNGLAADLQGWLSEVKGWEGSDRSVDSSLTISVEEVRSGRRMYLVKARGDGNEVKRFMLAGEGRLTGLGRRAVIGVGSRVGVGQPVWDVVLDGETWTVACDWGVI